MAKLTARFDMQDRITKRLKRVRTEAERLERARNRLNKPLIVTVRDRATRTLRSIGRYIIRDLAKVHRISMFVRDRASARIRAVGGLLQSRFPRTHQMLLQARDRATPMLRRINTFMKGSILRAHWMTINARDMATPVIRKVVTYARSTLSRGYSFTIRAIDQVTRTAGRMGAHINRAIPSVVSSTVRVIDMASAPLKAIARTATSTLGLLGIAGGISGGFVVPIKMVAEREDLTTAFEVMLGSAEAAERRMAELTDFAGRTPLTRDEIYRSSRVLQTFTGDALATAKGMEIVGDVAVGTQTPLEETAMWFGRLYDGIKSGRPIGMATNRLQEMGAISGEARARIEALAEAGGDINELWPQVTKEFGQYNGMMEKMSHNMSNLLLGLKSFVGNSILMPWGEGLRDAFKPALLAFREWRGEYSFVLKDMSRHLKSWGTDLMNNMLKPTKGVMSFIGEQMKTLFPGMGFEEAKKVLSKKEFKAYKQDIELRLKEDPEFKERWEELEYGRSVPFEVRWELMKKGASASIMNWWEEIGRDRAAQVGENIGKAYGGFIHSALIGILGGTAEETGNPFIDSGITAGKNFISGFIEALDPAKLVGAIAKAITDANKGAMRSMWGKLTGNEELEASGSIMGAVIANALVLAFLAKVGSLFKNLKPLADIAMRVGGFIFGKGKGGHIPIPKMPKAPKGGKPIYRMPWFGKGDPYSSPGPNQGKTRIPTPSRFPQMPDWLGKGAKGVGNLAKRVPVLGTLLGGLSIAAAAPEDRAAVTGSVVGGAGGAVAGAALGSIIPGVGTVIGGILGGIGGAIGGEKLVTWFQENWEGIKKGASDAATWVVDTFQERWETFKSLGSGIGTWFIDTVWEPIKEGASSAGEWLGERFGEAYSWVSEKWSAFSGWFDENVWTPFSDAAINTMNFFVGLWDVAWEGLTFVWGVLSDWFSEYVWEPIKLAASVVGEWISDRYEEAKLAVETAWGLVKDWFSENVWEPIKLAASIVGEWISERYEEAKLAIETAWSIVSEWFSENVWEPIKLGASIVGEWISETYEIAKIAVETAWGIVSGWFSENVWEPIKLAASIAGEWISDRYTEAKTAVETAWGIVAGWFDETVWNPISTAADGLKTAIGEAFEAGVALAKAAWEGIVGWFDTNIWSPLSSAASKVWEGMKGKWNDVKDWASGIRERGENITGVGPSNSPYAHNATGGYITRPTLSWIGEAGNEYVIPTENNVGRGRMLLQQAATDLGMKVTDRGESQAVAAFSAPADNKLSNDILQVISGLSAPKQESSGSKVNVEVSFNGDNHYSDELDAEKHGHTVVRIIREYLKDELNTGGDGIYDV